MFRTPLIGTLLLLAIFFEGVVAQTPSSSPVSPLADTPINRIQNEEVESLFGGARGTGIVRIPASAFEAGSGLIAFDEFPVNTTNPTYQPGDYGGDSEDPVVTFDGFFAGQELGDAASCPDGAALTGCVIGDPTSPLVLDSSAPDTSITTDGANPTSPVLSGTPRFNGPVAIFFDRDQAGIGLEGGFFDAIGGTAITAFDRDGNVLGSVTNEEEGIEFLGLVTTDGSTQIAGLLFSLVGAEPAGFAIDNLRFGEQGEVAPPDPGPDPDPEPPLSVPAMNLWSILTLILLFSIVGGIKAIYTRL